MTATQILGWLGGTAAVSAGVGAFVSKMAIERAASQWRREETTHAESIRHDLMEAQSVFQAAISSHLSGQAGLQTRRLEAVDAVWCAVLDIRETLSFPITFFSVLLPEEYDLALQPGGPFHELLAGVTSANINAVLTRVQPVESERPHLGETLWLGFFICRAFYGRLNFLMERGKIDGHLDNWQDDAGLRQLISAVLDETQVQAIYAASPGNAIKHTADLLEGQILGEIAAIASGSRSSAESFENARRMRDAVRGLDIGL